MNKFDALKSFYKKVVAFKWDTGAMSPYYHRHGQYQFMLHSDEICRTNLWWYLANSRKAKVVIVGDHYRVLDSYFTGIPMTHPKEMAKLHPAYKTWSYYSEGPRSLLTPKMLYEEHNSKLSRLIHSAISKSETPCLLLTFAPVVPYYEPDILSERTMALKEHQMYSRNTVELLQELKLPIVTIGKRAKKIAKLAKLKANPVGLPKKSDETWDDTLAEAVKKMVVEK